MSPEEQTKELLKNEKYDQLLKEFLTKELSVENHM